MRRETIKNLAWIFNLTKTPLGNSIAMTSKWARWRLKSPASRLSTQPFIQALSKENIKAPRHWPFAGNSPVTGEFPHKGSVTRNLFSCDDVIIIVMWFCWWPPENPWAYQAGSHNEMHPYPHSHPHQTQVWTLLSHYLRMCLAASSIAL